MLGDQQWVQPVPIPGRAALAAQAGPPAAAGTAGAGDGCRQSS